MAVESEGNEVGSRLSLRVMGSWGRGWCVERMSVCRGREEVE